LLRPAASHGVRPRFPNRGPMSRLRAPGTADLFPAGHFTPRSFPSRAAVPCHQGLSLPAVGAPMRFALPSRRFQRDRRAPARRPPRLRGLAPLSSAWRPPPFPVVERPILPWALVPFEVFPSLPKINRILERALSCERKSRFPLDRGANSVARPHVANVRRRRFDPTPTPSRVLPRPFQVSWRGTRLTSEDVARFCLSPHRGGCCRRPALPSKTSFRSRPQIALPLIRHDRRFGGNPFSLGSVLE